MLSLYENGKYDLKSTDTISVKNLVERYNDIVACWNEDINEENVVSFTYWLKEKVVCSRVWTNRDECAYVIFEIID